MNPRNTKLWLEMAQAEAGVFSKITRKATRGGVVQVSVLEALVDELFDVSYEDSVNGAWAKVFRDDATDVGPQLVAQGYAGTRDDALMHAVFGAVREERESLCPGIVDADLQNAGVQVDEKLRDRLLKDCIMGGPVLHAANMKVLIDAKASR